MHDAIEYKTKFDYYMKQNKMSILDLCDNFKQMMSFYGIIQLNDRVKLIEIRDKKATQQPNQQSGNFEQYNDIDSLKQKNAVLEKKSLSGHF